MNGQSKQSFLEWMAKRKSAAPQPQPAIPTPPLTPTSLESTKQVENHESPVTPQVLAPVVLPSKNTIENLQNQRIDELERELFAFREETQPNQVHNQKPKRAKSVKRKAAVPVLKFALSEDLTELNPVYDSPQPQKVNLLQKQTASPMNEDDYDNERWSQSRLNSRHILDESQHMWSPLRSPANQNHLPQPKPAPTHNPAHTTLEHSSLKPSGIPTKPIPSNPKPKPKQTQMTAENRPQSAPNKRTIRPPSSHSVSVQKPSNHPLPSSTTLSSHQTPTKIPTFQRNHSTLQPNQHKAPHAALMENTTPLSPPSPSLNQTGRRVRFDPQPAFQSPAKPKPKQNTTKQQRNPDTANALVLQLHSILRGKQDLNSTNSNQKRPVSTPPTNRSRTPPHQSRKNDEIDDDKHQTLPTSLTHPPKQTLSTFQHNQSPITHKTSPTAQTRLQDTSFTRSIFADGSDDEDDEPFRPIGSNSRLGKGTQLYRREMERLRQIETEVNNSTLLPSTPSPNTHRPRSQSSPHKASPKFVARVERGERKSVEEDEKVASKPESVKPTISPEQFLRRMEQEETEKKNSLEAIRRKVEEERMKECTFTPSVLPYDRSPHSSPQVELSDDSIIVSPQENVEDRLMKWSKEKKEKTRQLQLEMDQNLTFTPKVNSKEQRSGNIYDRLYTVDVRKGSGAVTERARQPDRPPKPPAKSPQDFESFLTRQQAVLKRREEFVRKEEEKKQQEMNTSIKARPWSAPRRLTKNQIPAKPQKVPEKEPELFRPNINARSKKMSRKTIDELSTGEVQKRQEKMQRLKELQAQKETKINTFTPAPFFQHSNHSPKVESKLGLRRDPAGLIKRMEQEKEERQRLLIEKYGRREDEDEYIIPPKTDRSTLMTDRPKSEAAPKRPSTSAKRKGSGVIAPKPKQTVRSYAVLGQKRAEEKKS
ncbi:hypothetical protein BLNAU_15304 [Blattamonas nauphoetae]|uniref:TPX2 C-terminal domain-containing protein n=1 Tax=Blattamonas nauphoetae TaxID=2049346 RepID=A0ABQ9XEC0_9EUKA|nr:hypothetical protein BLNAU_15304 [Blattamonas nauphoetae]